MAVFSNFPAIPTDGDASRIADWCEIKAVTTGHSLLRGALDSDMSRAGIEGPSAVDVFKELASRESLFAGSGLRPFQVDVAHKSLRYVPGQADHRYLFMAALALRESVKPSDRILFEFLTLEATKGLGMTGAVRMGAPRKPPMPAPINDAVDLYCREAQVRKHTPFLNTDKDLGLDVAAWRAFGDGRGSWLHLLVQCATGVDWDDKLEDLSVDTWRNHVAWGPAPVRTLAIPFIAASSGLERLTSRAGLLLDRPRILETLPSLSLQIDAEIQSACGTMY